MKASKFFTLSFILLTLIFGVTMSTVQADNITPVSVSGTGTYNNSPSLLIDGYAPAESTVWTAATNIYWQNSTEPQFTVDLGQIYWVDDITVQVDHNDSYRIDYSLDNSSWTTLFTIGQSYGEVGYGMDTMSSISSDPEYISQIDFSQQVSAQYLRISAYGGDSHYSVSELQAFGTVAPEPISSTLFIVGGATLGFRRFWSKSKTA